MSFYGSRVRRLHAEWGLHPPGYVSPFYLFHNITVNLNLLGLALKFFLGRYLLFCKFNLTSIYILYVS
jgi:hypothetical protein